MARARLLAVVVSVVLLVGACGDDDDDDTAATGTADGAALDLIQQGTLTVCTDFPYPPFEFEENGQQTGLTIELVRGIAEHLDLEAEFRDTDFDGIFAALAAGQCDMIGSSVSITEERQQNNLFSDPYFEINQSLLVRSADAETYGDLPALSGRTIGVQSGTTGADYAAENAEGAQIREFTGADEAITALRSAQVEAVLQDFPVNAHYAQASNGELQVVQVFEEEESEEYGFVMRQGNTSLKDAIDQGLATLRDEGTYDEIVGRYTGEEAVA